MEMEWLCSCCFCLAGSDYSFRNMSLTVVKVGWVGGWNICHEFTKASCPSHSENPKEDVLCSSGSCVRSLKCSLSCKLPGDSIAFSRNREKWLIPNPSKWELLQAWAFPGLESCSTGRPRGCRFGCENATPVKCEGYLTESWCGCIIIDWTTKPKLNLQEHSKVTRILRSQRVYSWASDHKSDINS